MTPLSTHGHFWLPDEPARRVSGQLMFDGSEIRLTLFESLAVQEWPESGVVFGGPKREEHERVFGRIFTDEADQFSSANPEQVTLMGVSAFTMQFPSAETTQTWAADSLLLGVHSQEQTARRVRLYFDALPAWCNSPWLVKSRTAGGLVSAATEAITLHRARLDNADVNVTASCRGT